MRSYGIESDLDQPINLINVFHYSIICYYYYYYYGNILINICVCSVGMDRN